MKFCKLCTNFVPYDVDLCQDCYSKGQQLRGPMYSQSQIAVSLPPPAQVVQRQQFTTYGQSVEPANTEIPRQTQDAILAASKRQRSLQSIVAQCLSQSQAVQRYQTGPANQAQAYTSAPQSDALNVGSLADIDVAIDKSGTPSLATEDLCPNAKIDAVLRDLDSIKPLPLKEKWSTITEESCHACLRVLNHNELVLGGYYQGMRAVNYHSLNFDHLADLTHAISTTQAWRKELVGLLQESSQTQPTPHASGQTNRQQITADSSTTQVPVNSLLRGPQQARHRRQNRWKPKPARSEGRSA